MDHGTRAPKTFRGTQRRLRRVRLNRSDLLLIWLFVAWLLVLLLVVLPFMARHPEPSNTWFGRTTLSR